jgi:hypothetical protein
MAYRYQPQPFRNTLLYIELQNLFSSAATSRKWLNARAIQAKVSTPLLFAWMKQRRNFAGNRINRSDI